MRSVILFEKYVLYEDGRLYSNYVKRFLNPCINGRGYLQFGLRVGGKHVNFRVHRLVAENFLERGQFSEVNHIDGNKLNNHVQNLEWCSRTDNIQHSYDMELRVKLTGEKNGRNLIAESKIHTICEMIVEGGKTAEIARRAGVNWHNVDAIRKKKNWKSVSDLYF